MKLLKVLPFTLPALVTITLASCTGGGDTPATGVQPGVDAGTGTGNVEDDPPPVTDASGPKIDAAAPSDDGGADGPYPTDNIGTQPRKGATPGNRIANFKFVGYPNGDKTGGLKPVSLAQFYDPTHKTHRILHIQASGVWSSSCQAQAKAVAPMKSQLDAKEVVWLITIAEGSTPGTPSKQSDLDGWLTSLKVPCTHVLDPGNANLSPFFDIAAFPWNANIDARTMEILTAGVGGMVTATQILEDLDDALALAATSKL